MRTPVFELHVRPMFRSVDREHMLNILEEFDLWSYDVVKSSIDDILDSVENGRMPPEGKGGPWPGEWIQLLRRWKETGFKRLDLGQGTYEVFSSDGEIELVANFTLPAPGWAGWIQLESSTETTRTYVVYFEPPDVPEEGAGEDIVVSEQFSGVQKLFLRDRDGLRELPIPP
jgi:hypothetical protein